MPDVVGAGQIAVHAIQRRGLRRTQMRAAILDLIPVEREDTAVVGDRGAQRRGPVGGGNRGGQMLEPVLDPFDRAPGRARCRGDQHDVGEDALLDAETAAGIRRRAQPQAIAGHFQRPRQHRMDAERALEIGEDIVSVFAGVVVGDHAIGFDRRAGIAGIADVDTDAMRCRRKGPLRIAVAKGPVAGDVAAKAIMQHRRIRAAAPRADRPRRAAADTAPQSDRPRLRPDSDRWRRQRRRVRRHSARARPRSASIRPAP